MADANRDCFMSRQHPGTDPATNVRDLQASSATAEAGRVVPAAERERGPCNEREAGGASLNAGRWDERFGTLDAGRWLAAAAVVLYHCSGILQHKPFSGFFQIGYHGVDFFFALSGFVIANAHLRDFGRPIRFSAYARKRFLRIYPPYWVATLLTIAWAFIHPSDQRVGIESTVLNLLLIPRSSVDYPLVVPAWTLFYEVLFYIFFGLLILMPRALARAALLLWPLAIYRFGVELHQGTFPSSFLMSKLILEFFCGVGACLIYSYLDRVTAVGVLILGLAMMGIALALEIAPGTLPVWVDQLPSLARYGGSSAAIIAGLAAIERRFGSLRSGVTDQLGNFSYSTYLIHYLVLMVLAQSGLMTRLAPLASWLVWSILALVCLAVGALFHKVLERPAVWVCRWVLSRQRAVWRLKASS
jgi:exopolysaccharide production protein ExoZ